MSEEKASQGIQSIELGFRILKCLEEARQPLSITELCKRLGMSGSKIHKYLVSFCRVGMLQQNENDSRYFLGPQLITFGMVALEKMDIVTVATPYLLDIKRQLNETVALSIWGDNGPYFVKWEQSNRLVNIGINVGSHVPLTNSATGKVFTAYKNRADTKEFLQRELQEGSIDLTEFENELDTVRNQEYAFTNGGLIPGIAAVSAPIFNYMGEIAAAVTIVGSIGLVGTEASSPTVQVLKQASRKITEKLSFGQRNKII